MKDGEQHDRLQQQLSWLSGRHAKLGLDVPPRPAEVAAARGVAPDAVAELEADLHDLGIDVGSGPEVGAGLGTGLSTGLGAIERGSERSEGHDVCTHFSPEPPRLHPSTRQ